MDSVTHAKIVAFARYCVVNVNVVPPTNVQAIQTEITNLKQAYSDIFGEEISVVGLVDIVLRGAAIPLPGHPGTFVHALGVIPPAAAEALSFLGIAVFSCVVHSSATECWRL